MSTEVDNYLEHMGIEVGDDLKHYGKRGMKWGVRKEAKAAAKAEKKAATEEQDRKIVAARINQTKRMGEMDRLAAKTYTEKTAKGREEASKSFDKAAKKTINHPDNETAALMTSGERHAARVQMTVGLVGLGIVGAVGIANNVNRYR